MDKSKKGIHCAKSLSWSAREVMVRGCRTGRYTKLEIWEKYSDQKKEHNLKSG